MIINLNLIYITEMYHVSVHQQRQDLKIIISRYNKDK